jgi:hypothetical protein
VIGVHYVDAPTPDVSGKLVVGLDSWVWRRFAEAQRTGNSLYVDAVDELERRVRLGQIVVPLDATVLFESHAWPANIRKETAAVAERLSGWLTFLPLTVRIRQEMDAALRQMFGRPLVRDQNKPDVGWGSHFSMTARVQRLALWGPEKEVASYVAAMGVVAAQDLLESFDNFAERSFIEGPSSDEQIQELRDVYGYRPEAAWEVASQRGDRHLRMQQNLAANADSRARIDDIVNASELAIEILDALNERILTADILPSELYANGAAGLTKLLDLMPSSVIRRAINRRALADRGREVRVNDVSDADLYSSIVPASDLVVAEGAVRQALSHRTVKSSFRAQLISGRQLVDLPRLLDSLAASRGT